MPPIQTFQNAPLHPDGVTPKTAPPGTESGSTPASNPQPTRTVPQNSDSSGPPPPQPGAFPIPGPQPTSRQQPVPPAPGPNPNYTPQSVTATVTTTTTSTLPPPPQLGIPPPTQNYGPSKSTSTGPPPRPGQPTTVNFGTVEPEEGQRHSLEHPPGYVQNPYAADGTAAERTRLQAAAANEDDDSILGTLKSAASEVGKFAQKVEKDAWNWIDNKGPR